MTKEATPEERAEAEAIVWCARMHSGEVDSQTRDAFDAWLRTTPVNRRAYEMTEAVYRNLPYVLDEAGLGLDKVSKPSASLWGPALALKSARSYVSIGLSIVSLVVVSFVAMPFLTASKDVPTAYDHRFETQVAEIQSLILDDGSTVTLGAKSRIDTVFTDDRRQVTLHEGEAFFEVSPDSTRPFFVVAQDTVVRVVGTEFDVKRSAGVVHVAVLEGVVEVMKPTSIIQSLQSTATEEIEKQVLTAGDRVSSVRSVALPQVRRMEQGQAGSWRNGQLTYDNASLAEIVADFNRYYGQEIRIASPEAAALRTTMGTDVSEIEDALEVLAVIHPIEIEHRSGSSLIVRLKD